MTFTRSLLLVGLIVVPQRAAAHHEAIFGPQASLFLSADGFVSFQTFSRRLGSVNREQETTGLLSAGLTPLSHVPLSFSVILPGSIINGSDHTDAGIEDVIVGTRYRFDFDGLIERFGGEGNFLMASAAVELPTGTVDHHAFGGPVDYMGALLASIDRPPYSGLAYAFYRLNGSDGDSSVGDNLSFGAGVGYTVSQDAGVTLQLGLSYESYFRDVVDGMDQVSGGFGVLTHPTAVWTATERVLVFGLVTLPIYQDYRDVEQEERWRVGAGVIYLFGHGGDDHAHGEPQEGGHDHDGDRGDGHDHGHAH